MTFYKWKGPKNNLPQLSQVSDEQREIQKGLLIRSHLLVLIKSLISISEHC